MRVTLLLAAFLALALVAPLASAGFSQHDTYAFTAVDSASFESTAVVTDEDARTMRQFADRNQDGTVTQPEAEQMVALFEGQASQSTQAALKLNNVTPTVANAEVDAQNLEGPTDSEEDVTMTITGILSWEVPADADTYTLSGAHDEEQPPPSQARLTLLAPEGYEFRHAQGFVEAPADGASLTGVVDPAQNVAITMAPREDAGDGEGADTPAPGALAALLVAAAVALARRRG